MLFTSTESRFSRLTQLWETEHAINYKTVLLSLAAAFVLLRLVFKFIQNPLRKIPGPWYAKWTNLPLKFAILRGERMYFVHVLHERYGAYVLIAPDQVAVASSDGFHQIHRIGSKFTKAAWYGNFTQNNRPNMFTMREPKAHAQRRKLFSRPFAKGNFREHWEPTVVDKIRLTISRMKEIAPQGPVDITKWWSLMANDIISQVTYGNCFHLLEAGEFNDGLKHIAASNAISAIKVEFPLIHLLSYILPLRRHRELFNPRVGLRKYAENAVQESRASDSKHMLAQMISEVEKHDSVDEFDLTLEAQGFLIAGSDTVAKSMTYLVWAVFNHAEWRAALEEEVDALPPGFADADTEHLPILNAIIDETLRLYSAAPSALPRTVPAGGIQIDGYHFDEGTTLSTQAYTFHRDPVLFPQPLKFDPTRWFAAPDGTSNMSAAAYTAYHPFGAGSRICLGMHLARMELRIATAEFFREMKGAKLAPSVTEESMRMKDHFVINPRDGKCEIVIEA